MAVSTWCWCRAGCIPDSHIYTTCTLMNKHRLNIQRSFFLLVCITLITALTFTNLKSQFTQRARYADCFAKLSACGSCRQMTNKWKNLNKWVETHNKCRCFHKGQEGSQHGLMSMTVVWILYLLRSHQTSTEHLWELPVRQRALLLSSEHQLREYLLEKCCSFKHFFLFYFSLICIFDL